MQTVEEHAAIRHAYYTQQRSIRQIARELNVSRQTIRKALESPSVPTYTLQAPRPAPILGPYKARIHDLLAENERLPRKQRYTLRRIYTLLKAEGYQGSDSHIRGYVATLRQTHRRPPVFLPLTFDPGQDAQADWGDAVAIIGGQRQTVQVFVMRLCFSRRTFVMAFPTQRQEAFFWGHVCAFRFFGGVPHRISYDNLATAVQITLQGHTRQEQRAFTAFRSHYLFASHFCTPNEGHEKGQVEHAVGFTRRNYLVPIPDVADFAALNAYLRQECEGDDQRTVAGQPAPIGDQWRAEQPALRALPAYDFPCCTTSTATLTPYSQVVFETNRYSVPTDQARKHVVVKAYPFAVELLAQDRLLAQHPRCYDRDQDIFDPLHYLPLLAQRPGAFAHATPLRAWQTQWPASYLQLLDRLQTSRPHGRGIREFIQILRLHQHHPSEEVAAAITQAVQTGCAHLAGVELCLHQLQHPAPVPGVLTFPSQPQLHAVGNQPIDLQVYEQLLEEHRAS